ncbi:NCAIR mutase-like protein [Chthonomonas calidirosea]|uniref:NCAIR mutase (PurE)-related proteins n=1 Tax=Chthonomonas calidirosea (strain DSM 23976 / ICMP 18418 / T49) TaxID=1303518 RepID=S0EXL1_CHTCT|nr:nickel pincer cofactor biosynthesis protein LarB [Chthonomonas calidirosea]CCW35037.1 NCAIR mutase (PurE)-related proteins [Chthonomonas calidirosea T49]CEK20504.1 NCAIR mutase-like protein [Chthonomonas calidirosea]CEK20948.1 NCAIR mutase-like protein [Chthonomonas calidirosea]
MEPERLLQLLEQVRAGSVSPKEALEQLRFLPFEDVGFARIDHHRALRNGFPEVVYCPNKTVPQIIAIMERVAAHASKVLATRATPEVAAEVRAALPSAVYHEQARMLVLPGAIEVPPPATVGTVLVVSAGTADLPVAEEAAVTVSEMGSPVERLYDVGVAGLHRLLANQRQLYAANVVIVVAGMEGALASVVGGLVARPVIAVPTSVGYGAGFGGLSALLTMLNSCASGVGVVNIDNGFGAGFLAHLINLRGLERQGV